MRKKPQVKSAESVLESLQTSEKHESIALYLPLSISLLVSEAAITFQVWQSDLTLVEATLQHLILLSVVACLLFIMRVFSFDLRPTLSLIVLTLFLGPFGALTGFGIGCFYLLYRKWSAPFALLLEQLFPDEQMPHPVATQALRIERGLDNVDRDTTAIPFMDIMTFGSLSQRLRAATLMLRYFHPKLGPALQLGLKDSNNSVRVLTATSLLALEEHFYNALSALEGAVAQNPGSRRNWLALAQHADEYAGSSILSPEREQKMLTVARQAYENYAALTTMTDEIRTTLARIDLHLGHIVNARDNLEALVTSGVRDASTLKLLGEACFRMADYAALRKLYPPNALAGDDSDQEAVTELAQLWNSEAMAHG